MRPITSFRDTLGSAILFLVIALALLPFTLDARSDFNAYVRHARVTQAVLVSEPWECAWSCSRAWVRFETPNGASHRVQLRSTYLDGLNGLHPGDRIRVRYDSRDLSPVEPADEPHESAALLLTILASVFGGSAVIVGILAWVRRPDRFRKTPAAAGVQGTDARTVTVWRRDE